MLFNYKVSDDKISLLQIFIYLFNLYSPIHNNHHIMFDFDFNIFFLNIFLISF